MKKLILLSILLSSLGVQAYSSVQLGDDGTTKISCPDGKLTKLIASEAVKNTNIRFHIHNGGAINLSFRSKEDQRIIYKSLFIQASSQCVLIRKRH